MQNVYQIDCKENKNLMGENDFIGLVYGKEYAHDIEGLNVLFYGSLYFISKAIRSSPPSDFGSIGAAILLGTVTIGYIGLRIIIFPIIKSNQI